MKFQYLKDSDVTPALDQKLRALLSQCFVKGQDAEIFSCQRYHQEMPQHRYLMWQGEELVAHVAVHDKLVTVSGVTYAISGIAEVCVHPKYRKRGLVKSLMERVNAERLKAGDAFALLFGDEQVYASSGYRCIDNLYVLSPQQEWVAVGHAMALVLNKAWPTGEVRLVGIPF